MRKYFLILLSFFLFGINSIAGNVISIEGFEDATLSIDNTNIQVVARNSTHTFSVQDDSLTLTASKANLNCTSTIANFAKDICVPKLNSSASEIRTSVTKSWKCAPKNDDIFFVKIDDSCNKLFNKEKFDSFSKKRKLEIRSDEYVSCLTNISKISTLSPEIINCNQSSLDKISCNANAGIHFLLFDGSKKTNFISQINTLCGIPDPYSSDSELAKIIFDASCEKGGFTANANTAELYAETVTTNTVSIPETLACQGCGKLAQQIQQTNDPGIRNQLIQQLGTRLRPALATAFGSSAAYAGSRSTVSIGSSPTRNFSGSSSARPRLPASYTGSKQNSFSNADASTTESSTGTDSGLGISTDSSTPGRGGQNVETSAQASSSSTLSRESASADGPGGRNPGGSAGITGSAQGGGGGGSSESAPPSDTFLGGNLTAQQQGIKSRLTAAPSADRARLVQTRQMISELANNGVQVRFSYKTDTYGVPKTGSPEIIWIIDRQGKITEYNPN